MMKKIAALARAIGPVRMAFVCSLLLSAVAVWNSPVLNRDGMLYVEWGSALAEHGLAAMRHYEGMAYLAVLPAIVAAISSLTRLGPEASAYLFNALALAGACSLLVAITRRRLPEAAWAACLVALAMPAHNEYRNQVLREYGFWFFSLLAIWLAMRWEESGRWREALACQAALVCAALFRQEALAYFPALMLWQAFAAPSGLRLRRTFMIGSLPVFGAALAILAFASGLVALPDRLAYFLDAANPLHKLGVIKEAAERMSEYVFKYKYSREEAGYVLFFGLLTIIPVKFLKMSGVFVVPLAFAFVGQPLRAVLSRWQPLSWVFFAHVLVLVAFLTHMFFLVGRYAGMLDLLAVPVAAAGLAALMQRFPRWRWLMLGLALLTMIANVVSLSPKSTQLIEAGKWLSANKTAAARIYVENPRVAFYAGLDYVATGRARLERGDLAKAVAENRFDMLVLDASAKEGGTDEWLAANSLRVIKRFANRAGHAVVIAVPEAAQDNPATTERSLSNTGPTE
jgi:hypothetical protein